MNLSLAELELDRDAMRAFVRLAAERVVHHLATLPEQRASDTEGYSQVARAVVEPVPETGQPFETLLDLLFQQLLVKGYNTASPGTLSYVTGGGLFHAAVADFIATATNPYVGYWYAAPGCAEIEHTVVRWFCDLIGLPRDSGGVLTSGGSMANLIALVTARILRLGDDFGRATIYASDQVHHSIEKAILFAGFPANRLRLIPTDKACRMQPEELSRAMARDRADGFCPFFVVATAGTTNTGAVDDMQNIAEIADEQGAWLHVDAAYGGFFALTERGRTRLAGIERADSVVLDPHKSLFLPFGTGCLLVRRLDDLRKAHLIHSDYLQTVVRLGEQSGATNIADLSPELSRDFRGLRVWLPIKLLGAATFRRSLDEKLDLTEWTLGELRAIDGIEILTEPDLTVLAFRVTLPRCSSAELDELNQRVLERINRKGRVHLSATTVHGRFALRICVLSFRVHRETLLTCLEDLREAIAAEGKR